MKVLWFKVRSKTE